MAKPAGTNVGELRGRSTSPISPPRRARPAGRSTAMPSSTSRALGRASACTASISRSTTTPAVVTIGRYTAAQDVGTAIHPSYVEGQLQGGAVQGIGWALNEEYIYNAKGQLENPGFLDYRMPVASDLPMIETIPGRGAQSPAPLRRTRCRRGADRSADRRSRLNAIARAIGITHESTCQIAAAPLRLALGITQPRRMAADKTTHRKPGAGGVASPELACWVDLSRNWRCCRVVRPANQTTIKKTSLRYPVRLGPVSPERAE